MAYRIFETNEFKKSLRELGAAAETRIATKLRRSVYPALVSNPRFGPQIKRLQGYEPPTWRYRVGDWRFFYVIEEGEKVVSMLMAEHRKEAYTAHG